MHSRWTTSGLTLLVSTGLLGCYSTWDIAPHSLTRLDGFRAGQERTLPAYDGDNVPFTSESKLKFVGRDGLEAQMQFQKIDFQDGQFVGEREKDGARLHVDLWRVREVQVQNVSEAKTTLAIGGMIVSTGAILIPMGLLAAYLGTSGGRPLRLEDPNLVVRAPVFLDNPQKDSHPTYTDEVTRTRIIEHWAHEASAECASIPAFLALARDLQKASATTNLVQAALRAAKEEATHTRLCLENVKTHAGTRARSSLPPTPHVKDTSAKALLERIVLEAFWDGCVTEGAAAILAQLAALTTTDEKTRLALQTIARDERSHAELAREIIRFGVACGGPSLRKALHESVEQGRIDAEKRLENEDSGASEDAVDLDLARAYGLSTQAEKQAARIEAWERSLSLLA